MMPLMYTVMTETLHNRNRSRSWSDFSDIVDEELNSPLCRVSQILVSSVMLCIAIYILVRLVTGLNSYNFIY